MTREWQEAANEAGKEANLNPIVRTDIVRMVAVDAISPSVQRMLTMSFSLLLHLCHLTLSHTVW